MEQLSTKQKVIIMLAIVSAMFFAAVNQTIVGTALPSIVADLGGVEYFNWVFTIFMLASSISGILVGKLSDIYGRKVFLLTGITIFLLASFMCGWSDTIVELIIYRGIQGLGGGIILSTSHASVGDLFPPRERGKWQGLLVSGFGLASVSGPTLGGMIADSFHWSWIFWVFLPFGFVAFLLIYWLLPPTSQKEKEPVDYFGSITLSLALISLLLAFSLGGVHFHWLSMEMTGLLVAAIILTVIFVKIEQVFPNPVVPLRLFKNKIFTFANLATFFIGAGMFGAFIYVPFFLQGVLGASATVSGFIVMPQMLFMVLSTTIFGMIISRFGKYKLIALLGTMCITLGMFLLVLMDSNTSYMYIVSAISMIGIGMGATFPVFTLIVQNAVPYKDLGVATSSAQLSRHLGATIGVSLIGIVMNARLLHGLEKDKVMDDLISHSEIDATAQEQILHLQDPQTLVDQKAITEIQQALPIELHPFYTTMIGELREVLGYSITGALLASTMLVLLGLVFALFIKETPLQTSNDAEYQGEKDPLKNNTFA